MFTEVEDPWVQPQRRPSYMALTRRRTCWCGKRISAGTLSTVGATGVDLGSRTSFDIAGADAFAFDGNTLYRVNLDTGAFTQLGNTGRALFGIAVSPVPEPTTWMMLLTGFAMVGDAARYRRKIVSAIYG